ncbi:MAG: hypothetical protein NC417_08985 [Candidatus Gastranaerophilales bacterium]|nr:hypothetical protein [Candidatus Gastranaerophilales bacterium]
MIKAKTTIIAGGKPFQAGQTVTGLSKLDRKWMSEAGYITETVEKKNAAEPSAQEEHE